MTDDQNGEWAERNNDAFRVPRRLIALAAVAVSATAYAHSVVDMGVAIRCPAFAAANTATSCVIDVTDYAYDVGLGIVVTATLPANSRFGSASAAGWTCSQSRGVVTCSAEVVEPGTTGVGVSWIAPPSGTARMAASVESLGTIDPVTKNDSATSDSAVYNPASCVAGAPVLASPADASATSTGGVDFAWSTVPGATRYRVWIAVEGAAPAILAETTETSLHRDVELGASEWWVEAIFASCPALGSIHRHIVSSGPAARYDVATLAGSAPGDEDGTLAIARFRTPASIGVDLDGNIYVIDSESSTLRHIGPDGMVTTVAGVAGQHGSSDGPAGFATMNHPLGVSVTPGGYVYVADTGNSTIRQYFPNGNGAVFGKVTFRIAGESEVAGSADANGASARFNHPAGIFVSSTGTILVADTGNNLVRQLGGITLDVATLFGKSAELSAPAGVIAGADGALYISDSGHDVVRRIARDGAMTTYAGFHSPAALAFDTLGNLYVADRGSDSIRRVAPSGLVTTVIPAGVLSQPSGIAFDAVGRLLIADAGNHLIRIATRASFIGAPSAPRRRGVRH